MQKGRWNKGDGKMENDTLSYFLLPISSSLNYIKGRK